MSWRRRPYKIHAWRLFCAITGWKSCAHTPLPPFTHTPTHGQYRHSTHTPAAAESEKAEKLLGCFFLFFPVNNAQPCFLLNSIPPLSPTCLSCSIMEKMGCRRSTHEQLITMPWGEKMTACSKSASQPPVRMHAIAAICSKHSRCPKNAFRMLRYRSFVPNIFCSSWPRSRPILPSVRSQNLLMSLPAGSSR